MAELGGVANAGNCVILVLHMLSVRLPAKLESRLGRLAKRTGRSKAFYVKRALEELLDEQEDYLIAVARLENELPSIPLGKVLKRLGLER